ncbi:MAG TPA: SPOR domain-containing protein [Terriglobia bacterium]|nr:SPOR domain-containing protein [Terriglobia bacterium]
MASRSEQTAGPGGLSVRQLTLIFLGAVGVSAMFFALGFLVGNNRRAASAVPSVEQISPPGEIPPVVNPPAQSAQSAGPAPNPAAGEASPIVEQDIKSQNAPSPKSQSNAAAVTLAPPSSSVPAPAQAPSLAETAGGRVMLQVAALRTQREARSLERRLKAHGFASVLLTPREAGTRDRMYRVQVGPFATRVKALAAQKKLKRAGFRSFIKPSR